MKIDLLSLVKSCKIFSSLDAAALKKIIARCQKVYLSKNQFLFKQGDFSNDLYIIVTGKLVVMVRKENGEKKFIREILPGETSGELAAISHEPRSATVKALENSILLKLASADFRNFSSEYPSVILHTIDSLAGRSHNLLKHISSDKPERKHIAIFPANKKISIPLFTKQMRELVKDKHRVAFVSDYDKALRQETSKTFKQYIAELEENNDTIIYLLALHKTELTKVCLAQVDKIYVVATSESKVYLNGYTDRVIHDDEFTYKTKPELILLHPEDKMPQRTADWLALADFGLCHHVRVDRQTDWDRVLRFISGKAIGVVLGGGGVRSWAHIGAIKGILESGFTIDAIGGSSAGAIVGAYYALHETYEDSRRDLHALTEATRRSTFFYNLTWPAVSLYNGTAYTLKQKEIFGSYKIEDLWLPFFCVSCNLSKNIQVVHRRGALWKKIRASTAVPGIFPPFVINKKIHADGGIVNNLPVDVMKKFSDSFGLIIGVELLHRSVDPNDYSFPPVLPLIPTLLSKLRIAYRAWRFPKFFDTFLRSLLVGSSVKQKENSLLADILIAPDLSEFNLLKINKKQETQIMQIGYDATIKAIQKWRKKQKQKFIVS